MNKGAVIFDFNRTLFDPTVFALYNGVTSMLEELKAERPLILFSRKSWDRNLLLAQLGIDEYFSATYFVEEKTPETLLASIEPHGLTASECIMVGDMLTDEICAANELGMTTVWFQQSRFGSILGDTVACVPHHTVRSIAELRELLRRI